MSLLNYPDLINKLRDFRLVPVVSLPSVQSALRLSEILLRCGLPVAEITFRTASAPEGMLTIKKENPDLFLLAGTVLTLEQAKIAVDSGASVIVSPGFSQKMADYCRREGIPYVPGICTPSEVQMAMDSGLEVLKFFPAEYSGGLKMITLFKAIYQDVRFMPTGGINLENIGDYLRESNVLCCGGTWLSPEQLMGDDRWEEIERRVVSALEAVSG